MQSDDHDERLDIEALEKLIAAKAEGRSDELDAFAGRDERRAAAVERAKAAAAVGSTKPEHPEFPPEAAAESQKGRFGVYRLLEELGRGGQGEVWLAEDSRLGRRVALKILHRGVAASDDALLRFRREGEIAAKLDHPGLCGVYDVGRENGRAWMAMRYVEGRTFARRWSERTAAPGDREELLIEVKLVEDVARAVHMAHEAGIVHRDLKPSNLMVGKDGAAVVLDFGLAHDDSAAGSTITAPGAVFGTPAYMAPEQLLGQAGLDRRVDVYALGVVLYQALTGRLPREGPTFEAIRAVAHAPVVSARKLNPSVPRNLEIVVATALASDLSLRYRTAVDLAEDLRRIRTGEPILARNAGPLVRLASWIRRNRALAAAVFGLFAVLASGLAVSTSLGLAERRRYTQLIQVSDVLVARDLVKTEEDLWPEGPEETSTAETWIRAAEAALPAAPRHFAALEELRLRRNRDGGYADPGDAWFDGALSEVISLLDRIAVRLSVAKAHLGRAKSLRARTIEGDAALEWAATAQRMSTAPSYAGTALRPQPGLRPLGPDPSSQLEEFWVVDSGDRPVRNAGTGAIRPREQDGIVLVLLPGGTFPMGAFVGAELTDDSEKPRRDVTIDPFFLSKFEITQAQWMRGSEGRNCANYRPDSAQGSVSAPKEKALAVNPVESMSWIEADRWVRRLGLKLPTEAQWEYACHDDDVTRFGPGDDREDVEGFANVAGIESPFYRLLYGVPPAFNDGYILHTPVGTYKASGFGLFDLHGNVGEWCRDAYARTLAEAVPRPGDGLMIPRVDEGNRPVRGGTMQQDLHFARCSARQQLPKTASRRDIGCRPSRALH